MQVYVDSSEQAYASAATQSWLQAVIDAAEHQSQEPLFQLLRKGRTDNTVHILNQSRQWIGKVYPFMPAHTEEARLAVITQYLYKRTLYKLLSSLDKAKDGSNPAVTIQVLLARNDLQIGLLNACVEVVSFCNLNVNNAEENSFPACTEKMELENYYLEQWRGLQWIIQYHLVPSTDGVPAMPADLQHYLETIQVRIVEELGWLSGNNIYHRMLNLGSAAAGDNNGNSKWRLKPSTGVRSKLDEHLLASFLTQTARLVMDRTAEICRHLSSSIPELQSPTALANFIQRCCIVVDATLSEHIKVLFNQHLSAVCVSCIYYTARLHQLSGVKLSLLTSIAEAHLPLHPPSVFKSLDLSSAVENADESEIHIGTVREYYNHIMVPCLSAFSATEYFGDGFEDTLLDPELVQQHSHDVASPEENTTTTASGGGVGGSVSEAVGSGGGRHDVQGSAAAVVKKKGSGKKPLSGVQANTIR